MAKRKPSPSRPVPGKPQLRIKVRRFELREALEGIVWYTKGGMRKVDFEVLENGEWKPVEVLFG